MGYTETRMRSPGAFAEVESETTLVALLERYRAGDRTALGEFIEQMYPYVYRFVYRLIGSNRHDVHEDLVQAALERLCYAIAGFEGRSRITTFVFGVCYRVVSRHRRAERIRTFFRRAARDACGPQELVPPDELLERERLLAQARRALEQLQGEERAAFVLHEIEGLPLDEVATVLGCSTRTVKRRLRAARLKLTEVRR